MNIQKITLELRGTTPLLLGNSYGPWLSESKKDKHRDERFVLVRVDILKEMLPRRRR